MMTREKLAKLLNSVNVEALHKKSGVSIKTIYRLRHCKNPPNLSTVEKLVSAARELPPSKRRRAAA